MGYEDGAPESRAANEFDYARLAAESFGAHHREARMTDADFRDLLPKIVWHLDEPIAAQMEEMFEEDLKRSVEITLGRFKRRSFASRMKESVFGVFKKQL